MKDAVSYTGILVTPPATLDSPVLLNQHPDAPIQVFDAGDGLHYWLPTPDGTRYFVCRHEYRQINGRVVLNHPLTDSKPVAVLTTSARTFFTVRYWNPEQVMIGVAYSGDDSYASPLALLHHHRHR